MTNLNYHCPICETKGGNILGQLKYILFDDSPLSDKIDIISCPKCGFVRYNPLLAQKNYEQYKNTDILNHISDFNYKYSHIIEHIVDLNSVLNKIRNELKKDEKIYIEVPDADEYDYQKDKNPLRYFYISHINHFNRTSLNNLLFSNHFKEVDSGHCMYKEGILEIPSIWGIYCKADGFIDGKRSINHDFSISNKIKSWFNNNNINNLDNDNILTNLALSEKVIYIWGIGIHTQIILGMSPLKNYLHRIYFVDSNKKIQEKTIAGKMIHDISILHNATKDDIVIIGSPTHSKVMYEQLVDKNKIGFKGQVIIIEFGNVRSVNQTV